MKKHTIQTYKYHYFNLFNCDISKFLYQCDFQSNTHLLIYYISKIASIQNKKNLVLVKYTKYDG